VSGDLGRKLKLNILPRKVYEKAGLFFLFARFL
jgi:hypothetical protein